MGRTGKQQQQQQQLLLRNPSKISINGIWDGLTESSNRDMDLVLESVPSSSFPHKNSLVNDQHLDCEAMTMDPISGGNSLNNNPNLASKQRLRWTHELHERFVDAVAQLGGPDRKKVDKKETGDKMGLSNLGILVCSGMQITEALKLQMEVQRQLQLRIEAQGKYLKKIIEEQQRLSGVLEDVPGSGVSAPVSGDNCPESDNKRDPATPAPTSESPLQDKVAKECAPTKSLSIDESFSSQHEPLTPDSRCNTGSPAESPRGERSLKKQMVSMGVAFGKPEMVLTHQILESSLNSYPQPHSAFLTREQFDPSSGLSMGNEDQSEVLGSDL
ncbi:hypothetical protein NC651_034626 [Populus alba x Populus x berolinensis]|nr:hypothetical protein NC651_034626 [Populus alba x Populus x berolinensis]